MKKSVFAFILLFVLCIIFISCNKDASESTTASENSQTGEQTHEVIKIVPDGVTQYITVVSETCPDSLREAANRMKAEFYSTTGRNIWIKNDTATDETEFEILIGATNRKESAQAAQGLEKYEYIIKLTDKKIIITGGSNSAVIEAIKVFTETYSKEDNPEFALPLNLNLKGEISHTLNFVSGWNKAVFNDSAVSLPYQIYIPQGYDAAKEYPVILFLHGLGLNGNDNEKQLSGGESTVAKRAIQSYKDVIVIAPQCPAGARWVQIAEYTGFNKTDLKMTSYLKSAVDLLDSTCAELSADDNRIYLAGYSMGAMATWFLLAEYPDRWAAAVPAAGCGDPSTAYLFKDVPIWAFHGDADTVVPFETGSKAMIDALMAAGGKPVFTVCSGAGHGLTNFLESEKEIINWLFSQKKNK